MSYGRWKVQWRVGRGASFCWLGRAPTEPFNEMTVCYMNQTGARECEVRVCVSGVPLPCVFGQLLREFVFMSCP